MFASSRSEVMFDPESTRRRRRLSPPAERLVRPNVLGKHAAAVRDCAMSRDARLALSASDDRSAALWSLDDEDVAARPPFVFGRGLNASFDKLASAPGEPQPGGGPGDEDLPVADFSVQEDDGQASAGSRSPVSMLGAIANALSNAVQSVQGPSEKKEGTLDRDTAQGSRPGEKGSLNSGQTPSATRERASAEVVSRDEIAEQIAHSNTLVDSLEGQASGSDNPARDISLGQDKTKGVPQQKEEGHESPVAPASKAVKPASVAAQKSPYTPPSRKVVSAAIPELHNNPVVKCGMSNDGSRVVTLTRDCTIRFWSGSSGSCEGVEKEKGVLKPIDLWVSSEAKLVIAVFSKKRRRSSQVVVYTWSGSGEISNVATHHTDHDVFCMSASAGQKLIAFTSTATGYLDPKGFHREESRVWARERSAHIVDMQTFKEHRSIPLTALSSCFPGIAVASQAPAIAIAERTLRVVHPRNPDLDLTLSQFEEDSPGEVSFTGPSDTARRTLCAISANGKFVVSFTFERSFSVWSVASGSVIATFRAPAIPTCIAISHVGLAVVGYADGNFSSYDYTFATSVSNTRRRTSVA